MFENFCIHYRNAMRAIAQIDAGEWVPEFNPLVGKHLTAARGDKTLWIGNGPFFLCMYEPRIDYFGYFWRHVVWWRAARKLQRSADRRYRYGGKGGTAPML